MPVVGAVHCIRCGHPMRHLQANLNDQNRPKSAIQVRCHERLLSDRKQAIEIRLLQAAQTSSNRINEGHRQGCLVLNETI